MSALAEYMLKCNKCVSGSDCNLSHITKKLCKFGVKVHKGHKKSNIKEVDLVVFSGAIAQDNPEILAAKEKNIPIMERSDFLSIVANQYKNVIAVAGAHGKTTTTAMIARIFMQAGLKPCIHLGGEVNFLNGNLLFNKGEYFITEACEYRKSFLSLSPTYAVVLNVEKEHIECYGTLANIKSAFKQFASSASKGVVYNAKLDYDVAQGVSFSLKGNATFTAKKIVRSNFATQFDCYKNSKFFCNINLNIIGEYNIKNALAAIALCDMNNISQKEIKDGLEVFTGVKRRFEFCGKLNRAKVVHDYAHHPTEIASLLKAVKQNFDKKIFVVFQPHTYSRTINNFNKFLKVFGSKDIEEIILIPTYAAREKPLSGGRSEDLYESLNNIREKVLFMKNNYAVKKHLKCVVNEKSIILVVGAGSIEELAHYLVK